MFILKWLVLVLVLALGFVVGLLPASAVEGGAGSVFGWGVFAGVLYSAFAGWIGWMFLDMDSGWDREEILSPKKKAVVLACVTFIVTFVPPAETIIHGHEWAAYLRSMAAPTQEFGIKHFAEIDADHDNTATTEEMDAAENVLSLTERERELLHHMNSQRSEIGHVIGSYTSTTFVWISTGKGGYMSPVTTTTYIYGISVSDLQLYPARLQEKWKSW